MTFKKSAIGIALGATLLGAGFTSAIAAEPTIRELAKERGRFIGTILNSEWFNDDIEPEFEEIHKTQFNVVVAENEMKFDATEPAENEFNFTKGDKMVEYAKANKIRVRGHALAQPGCRMGQQQLRRAKGETARRPQEPHREGSGALQGTGRRMGRSERGHKRRV